MIKGLSKVTALLAAVVMAMAAAHAYGGEYSEMKDEYNGAGLTRYASDSLGAAAPVPAPAWEAAASNLSELQEVKQELSRRRAAALGQIDDVVVGSGLFEPTAELWQRVKGADATELEAFLTERYDLDTLLTVALAANPTIKKSRVAVEAAAEKYDQVSNLDEILGKYSVFTKELSLPPGAGGRHKRPVAMNFPFPGMLSLKGAIVDKEIDVARLKLLGAVQTTVTKVKQAYYDLLFLDHSIRVTEEVLGLARRMKGVVNTVYTTGKKTLNDVVKIKMEVDRLENSLVNVREKRRTAVVVLNKLVGVSAGFTLPEGAPLVPLTPVMLDYSTKELFKRGTAERTEVVVLVKKIEKMALAIEMGEKKFYPDLSSGMSLFQNVTTKQVGTGAVMPAFSVTPMVRGGDWFGTNDAYMREVRKKYQMMGEALEELRSRTVTEINRSVFIYEKAKRDLILLESSLVPSSKLTVEITETMYTTGKVDFMDLVSSEQMYLDFSLKLKKSVRDLNVEAARLERLVGSKIKRVEEDR